MTDFDPYHKWLGIPPKDQPPNHYRLLGIELFESDPDVVDAAAEQRTSFVRQCATGPRMAESQRMLNEIATARLCLLHTEKRLAYDAGLAAAVEPNLSEKLAVPTDAEPWWKAVEVEAEPQQEVRAVRHTRQPTPSAQATNHPVKPAVLVCGGLAGLALLVFFSMNRNGETPPPDDAPNPSMSAVMPRANDTTQVKVASSAPTAVPSTLVPATTETSWPKMDGFFFSYTSASTGMRFALIQAGTFTMGSPASEANRETDEGPQHTVRITQPFYMGVYEVTQAEYESVMGTNPSYFSKTGSGKSDVSGMDTGQFPVETVSWEHAQEFCQKLSVKDGLTYRLPTEAEWEYACRANTTTPFHFGGTLNGDKANVNGKLPYGTTTSGEYLKRPTTVGSYSSNAFGLYNMHGNVWEWCEDAYDESAYGKRSGTTADPKVTAGSQSCVVRGGSWLEVSKSTRSADRGRLPLALRGYGFGFRVVFSASAIRTP